MIKNVIARGVCRSSSFDLDIGYFVRVGVSSCYPYAMVSENVVVAVAAAKAACYTLRRRRRMKFFFLEL